GDLQWHAFGRQGSGVDVVQVIVLPPRAGVVYQCSRIDVDGDDRAFQLRNETAGIEIGAVINPWSWRECFVVISCQNEVFEWPVHIAPVLFPTHFDSNPFSGYWR